MPPFRMIFVPANRPARFNKAATSGADAVSPADKPAARDALCAARRKGEPEGQVFARMNPAGTPDHATLVDGQMVDLPVIAAAQRLVTQAAAIAARLPGLAPHRPA